MKAQLTEDAVQDVRDSHEYIARHDSVERATQMLDGMETAITGLSQFPERGRYPPELAALGIREYREIVYKPYRILYRPMSDRLVVYVIADGRRDFRSVLERRLLRAT